MEPSDLDTLVLESKYPEFQFCVKGPIYTTWEDGFPRQVPKLIVLNFDRYLCLIADEIRDQEWTDEDRVHVAKTLEAFLNNPNFTDMWKHERAKPGAPWPTYDEMDAKQIPMIAQATGKIADALVYEREGFSGGPREAVVKKLEDLLTAEVDAAVTSDDFAAV